ncbi:type VI secretion system domain-containing protein [Catenovulum sp. SM1970]|uniref:TssA family type VI secretion system protein n=1 Tax=Marinifaba aquimaris TaxID=2741323 RepID=UPI00157483A3|nr:TssA family type VI secretion system protein [Marinifaba aquimaris]NTS77906.1 type VI secretion system domain-containing protein [Marinifaba aquimaris]
MTKPYTHNDWQEWLESLLQPIKDRPCGEDLKYEEDFKAIKASFSSLEVVDYKPIFITLTELLATKTKDLRLAGYLTFAAAHEFGFQGLCMGFVLFNRFLTDFESDVFPETPKARRSVHKWFLGQQARLQAVTALNHSPEPQMLVDCQSALYDYSQNSVPKLDENAGPLSDINAWLDKLAKANPIQKTPEPVEQTPPKNTNNSEVTPAIENVTSNEPSLATKALETDSDYLDSIRELIKFDRDKQQFVRMLNLARTARWGLIKVPPNEAGKTRLPAPRQTAFSPIKNAIAEQNYQDAFLKCEALFLEGAMHFNLDLQMLCYKAIKGMSQPKLVTALELQLLYLITFVPNLSQLTYEDGTPFCSATNKDLMSEIESRLTQSEASSAATDELDEMTQQAFALVEKGQCEQALKYVSKMTCDEPFKHFQKSFIQAQVLVRAERLELALPILTELNKQIEEREARIWRQDFVIQVWRQTYQCLMGLSKNTEDDFALKATVIKNNLILTRPEAVLSL